MLFPLVEVSASESGNMDIVTPGQDFANLWSLIASSRGLGLIGQCCGIVSLIILAADIRRVHAEIHTARPKGVEYAEQQLAGRMADKQIDMAKLEDAARGRPLPPQTREEFHREIREIIYWHQLQMQLSHTRSIFTTVDAKVSAERSKGAVEVATVIAVAGICAQVLAAFIP
jgi:hypothetical protein